MSLAPYNTSETLWRMVPTGYRVQLVKGMLFRSEDDDGWVARFADDADAIRTLSACGFERQGEFWTKVGEAVPK